MPDIPGARAQRPGSAPPARDPPRPRSPRSRRGWSPGAGREVTRTWRQMRRASSQKAQGGPGDPGVPVDLCRRGQAGRWISSPTTTVPRPEPTGHVLPPPDHSSASSTRPPRLSEGPTARWARCPHTSQVRSAGTSRAPARGIRTAASREAGFVGGISQRTGEGEEGRMTNYSLCCLMRGPFCGPRLPGAVSSNLMGRLLA